MSKRHQNGYVFRKGSAWYLRYYEPDASGDRIQRCRKLVDYSERYRSKSDVQSLAEEFLRPLNDGKFSPQSMLPVAEFVERCYLPFAQENCRPSTYSAYKTQWERYLAPRLRNTVLRDFRTVDAANLLADIHRSHGLGRSTLRHLKAFMSAVFTFAKNQGALDGVNPVQDAMIPRKAAAPGETHATTPDEVLSMIEALEKAGERKASCAVALMFFAGLRPGEARGIRWEDFDGRRLNVRQSIWRSHATEPKTAESCNPVPVIDPLRSLLVELRMADGNPEAGPILRSHPGKPLNLDNLAKRIVRPILLAAGLKWHGWYALRRGIATLVNSVEKDAMAAKGLLRHASVITTQKHYIKEVPETTRKAMEKIETLCTNRATAETSRPS